MTAREQMNRRLRPLVIGLYAGFALAFGSAVLGSFLRDSPIGVYEIIPVAVGIPVAIVCMLVIQFGIRCPFCRLRLGHVLLASGHVWGFGKEFNFCPKCGTSLDQEVST